jgi:hypothetical protein
VGKHDDRKKNEDERKQQSNGQPPTGTRITPNEPDGRHSAPEENEE